MTADLGGKVALITGASRGIGAATAAELALAGGAVVLVGRVQSTLDDVLSSLPPGSRSLAVTADMANTSDLDRLVAETVGAMGGIDILVNNAGVYPKPKQVYDIGLDEWQHVMDVNLRAPWYLSKLVHPHMRARGGGVIVNVSSTSGLRHHLGRAAYGVSKAGLVMLTEACAMEWARDNIRVNCIAPGVVKTELAASLVEYLQSRETKPNPLNLFGEPEDVARLLRYLVSDDARLVTGATIRIDGGELL
jgi:NAD(P)-dependent dehydrogenase (short-subunit alcohol dehydrogenase family)